MGGMFPSTQTLEFNFQLTPIMDVVTGNLLPPTTGGTFGTATILDPAGNPVTVAAQTYPETVTIGPTTFVLRAKVTALAANFSTAGVYTCQLDWQGGGAVSLSSDAAQWGGLADLIVAINTETQPGGTMYESVAATETGVQDITNYLEPGGAIYDPVQRTFKLTQYNSAFNASNSRMYQYEDDGTTVLGYWTCYTDVAKTTLATTRAAINATTWHEGP